MQIIKKKQKEIDFYARYFYDPKAEERKRLLLTAGLPIFVILLVILGIFCGLKISDAVHKHEISNIQEYLDSPSVQSDFHRSLQLQSQLNELSTIYSEMNEAIESSKTLPGMDDTVMAGINQALSGAKIVSHVYDAESRTLQITATTSTASEVPGLIRRLKSTGDFSQVTYSGYEDSNSKYLVTISCVFF